MTLEKGLQGHWREGLNIIWGSVAETFPLQNCGQSGSLIATL